MANIKVSISIGMNKETAQADACRTEYVISEETFTMIRKHLDALASSIGTSKNILTEVFCFCYIACAKVNIAQAK